jgi:catechol 2,3-dioxygenase-like lactoylglutathione lyase family enzyme
MISFLMIRAWGTHWACRRENYEGSLCGWGHDANAPVLDLVQFIDPPAQGQPYPTLNNIGICRVAFTVDDIDKTYEELKTKRVEFLAPLKKIDGPGGSRIGVVCFKDPDGTILELISGM